MSDVLAPSRSGTHKRFGIGRNACAFRYQAIGLLLMSLWVMPGCESFSDAAGGVREKFATRDQPKLRVFNAEPRETYAAALKALEEIGFRYVRGGPAQGRLEAVSGLTAGKSLAMTQQLTLKATFEIAPEGGTAVALHLYEVIENNADKGQGQGVASPMRDTPLYESFFREMQAQLAESKKA